MLLKTYCNMNNICLFFQWVFIVRIKLNKFLCQFYRHAEWELKSNNGR